MTMTDLDRQLEDLRSAADAYAARHQFIEDLAWPEGVRIAVNFTCDFDAMLLRRLLNEPPMQLAKGEFGGRVGIWRLVDLFDAHDVKATIITPGRICELYPQALRAVVKSGHEIRTTCGSTGCRRSPRSRRIIWPRRLPRSNGLPAAVRLARAAAIALSCSGNTGISIAPRVRPTSGRITSSTKRAATAWSTCQCTTSSMTPCTSTLTGSAPIRQHSGSRPGAGLRHLVGGVRQQYNVGGYLNVCMHPFQSGRALRIAMLDRLITRMKSLPGVWFPTCEQVARHCIDRHPARAGAL